MTLVADASFVVLAVTGAGPAGAAARERLSSEYAHAPHLVDAEVGNVLRRRWLRGELRAEIAVELLGLGRSLVDQRHDHGPLASAAWGLRANLSFYDALYAVLAWALDTPLVTADERLARAPGLPCRVEAI